VGWLLGILILMLPPPAFSKSPPQQKAERPLAVPQIDPPALIVRFISIDGGGGQSSDGELILRGTIGQVQNGESSTCGRKVSNGVWFVSSENDLDIIFNSGFEFDATCQ
jgi:hypothetical protein